MGRGKGCPCATGSHWFGDGPSKSYRIFRGSCSGTPLKTPALVATLPQTATASARPASGGCRWASAGLVSY